MTTVRALLDALDRCGVELDTGEVRVSGDVLDGAVTVAISFRLAVSDLESADGVRYLIRELDGVG